VGAYIGGGAGTDQLVGGEGPDRIDGESEADTIDARGGSDFPNGGAGGDVVLGGAGDDISQLDYGSNDRIDLGPGTDWFLVFNSDGTGDVLQGGDGVDSLLYAVAGSPDASATVDLARGRFSHDAFGPYDAATDTLEGIEDAGETGGQGGDDTLIGSAGSNLLAGGRGDDTIVGGSGTDTLLGDKYYIALGTVGEFPLIAGVDTIDAADGFEDRIDCGPKEADSVVVDQLDLPLMTGCESVDVQQAPSGTPDAPGGAPGDTPGAPQGPGSGAAADVRAPVCRPSKLDAKTRAALVRRGFSFTLECDEQARVAATARVRNRVLDTKTLDYGSGRRKLVFRIPRRLRHSLGKRFTVRVRIDATDRAGNRSTRFAGFKVR
jgi:Ca2+-binding RTX toxin-like protein